MTANKISQFRNEVINVRNQREVANAVHRDAVRTQQRILQSLQDKIVIVEQKRVLLHEAKGAMDRSYSTGEARQRPLQCVVTREAMLLATMRDVGRLATAKHLAQAMKNQIRKSMQCELRILKEERTKLLTGFREARNVVLKEMEAIRMKCDATLQHQREELAMLNSSRHTMDDATPKKSNFFDSLVAATSPMSLFKSTSEIFQLVPRTA